MKKTKTKVAPKPKKEVAPKAEKVKKVVVPKYELLTFSVKATIPTQMYGNIMPEIVIKAKTIEDARAVVLPAIESLYVAYCEKPRDGSVVSFMNKASVTSVEKKVEVPPATKPATPATAPVAPVAPKTITPATPAPAEDNFEADENAPKSPAYEKASGAIKNSMSLDALNLIEGQIQKSEKLSAEEKPMLLTEVLKKRKEFA